MFKTALLIFPLVLFSKGQDFLAKIPIVEQTGKLSSSVGCIYNIFKGSPLASLGHDDGMSDLRVFELTYNNNQKTDDEKYLYPDQWHFENAFSCSYKGSSQIVKGMKSYQNSLAESAKVETDMDFGVASASFTAGTDYKKQYQETQENSDLSVLNEVMCSLYYASMDDNIDWTLSPHFVQLVKDAYEGGNGTWVDFINLYGTHFVYSTVFGAAGRQSTIISQSDTSTLSSVGLSITAAVKASYGMMSGSVESKTDYNQEQNETLSQIQTTTETWFIGNPPAPEDDFVKWQDEVQGKSIPMPLKYKLRPLESVFTTQYFTDMSKEELSKMKDSFQTALKEIAKNSPKVPEDPDMPANEGMWTFPQEVAQNVPMWSTDHLYYLLLGEDGILQFRDFKQNLFWNSCQYIRQEWHGPFSLELNKNGDVCVNAANQKCIWATNTAQPGVDGGKGFSFKVEDLKKDEGNLVVYTAQGNILWDLRSNLYTPTFC